MHYLRIRIKHLPKKFLDQNPKRLFWKIFSHTFLKLEGNFNFYNTDTQIRICILNMYLDPTDVFKQNCKPHLHFVILNKRDAKVQVGKVTIVRYRTGLRLWCGSSFIYNLTAILKKTNFRFCSLIKATCCKLIAIPVGVCQLIATIRLTLYDQNDQNNRKAEMTGMTRRLEGPESWNDWKARMTGKLE